LPLLLCLIPDIRSANNLHAAVITWDVKLFRREKFQDLGRTPANPLFLETLMPAVGFCTAIANRELIVVVVI
jgi:hypothetical protein